MWQNPENSKAWGIFSEFNKVCSYLSEKDHLDVGDKVGFRRVRNEDEDEEETLLVNTEVPVAVDGAETDYNTVLQGRGSPIRAVQ